MSSHSLFTTLLFLLFFSTVQIAFATNSTGKSTSLQYIKSTCNQTTYPKLCYALLSPYASKIKTSPLLLIKTSISSALNLSKMACSTLAKLSKMKGLTKSEKEVVQDCQETIDDTLDELKKSFSAVKSLNGSGTMDEKLQWSNIKTWMSAAITDETTCTDEFDDMKVRASVEKIIKTSVDKVARITSISLALVNNLS